ncbi:SMP-30/gluconolactonase/LRE family protein [Niabella beijingensis]|uniref:SMP-30/gluconolactonase/LRE family protein n=1 Tax=Niabella beijingensis TaxID=2872700 RepID=UPI001CC06E32|nr:SMP-30/gluconolactonase/LRE family protein [Niabella beijingensis]MBZ4191398.1 SMP-30/gluconolactonase/LRE family protein [Niabella beijingensis]
MYKNQIFQEFKGRTLVLPQPFYTEGPVIDKEGNLFVTNLKGGQLLRIDKNGNTSVWAETTCPNGQMINEKGIHLVCDSVEGSIKRFDKKGRPDKVVMNGFISDHKICCPNDLVSDNNGGFFFTDSVRHCGIVGYVDRFGAKRIIARNLDYPNGLALNPFTHRLYIAESYRNRILVTDLRKPWNSPGIFCDLPANPSGKKNGNLPDGLALDCFHNLWVAHYGMSCLWILNDRGQCIGKYDTGITLTSNVFMNDDFLLVTGGTGEPGPGIIKIVKMHRR